MMHIIKLSINMHHTFSRNYNILFQTLVFLSIGSLCLSQTCDIPLWTNGCSVPLQLPFFYKDRFTVPCNHHDICYHCGYTFGISREMCDQLFLEKMHRLCGSARKPLCGHFARLYYGIVRKIAMSHYRRKYSPECIRSDVIPCLS